MKLSFVIPCYRSERTIENVVNEIIETVKTRENYDYEIILVNDGSPDNVIDVIKNICLKNDKVKCINLGKNFGQANAKMAGYKYTNGDYIFSLDDDGQIAVDELYKLVDKLDEGYDVVFAKYEQKKHSFFRNLGSKINNKMANILIGKPKELVVTSFVVMRPFVVKEIIKYKNPYPYPLGIITSATNKITNVQTNHRKRQSGESGYNLKRLLKLWVNGATNFSVKPLRIAIIIGIISAMAGFGYGTFAIIQRLFNSNIQSGWSSIVAIILFMGGIILCVLGIMGEYLGRIYMALNNIPQYVISEKLNIDDYFAGNNIKSKDIYSEEYLNV